jgi:hypothetical protein
VYCHYVSSANNKNKNSWVGSVSADRKIGKANLEFNTCSLLYLYTVKPVLRDHLWEKEKVAL